MAANFKCSSWGKKKAKVVGPPEEDYVNDNGDRLMNKIYL